MGIEPLPSDFYGFEQELTEQEQGLLNKLRAVLDDTHGIVQEHWHKDEFPHGIIEPLAKTGALGFNWEETWDFQGSAAFRGWIALEMGRADASIGTFAGVQNGLASGSIGVCGSPEQRAEWLPKLASGEIIGAFGLTEPESGSDASLGLKTGCRREGDEWVINGAKRWIGNATFADIVIIWARDEEDGQVKGFIVPTETEGFTATKIENKIALRMVENADITLESVRVPESLRLQKANSFRDTAKVLKLTRAEVAWLAVGVMAGAYEAAVRYAKERVQFGKPIGQHQLVQELLAKSLANITASIALCTQVSKMQDEDRQEDAHSAMAKMFVTARMREVVAWAREVCGGNGIVTDYDAARYFADAEALYSYEGTYQMNALIVGRSIIGKSAFA
ncbi:acyl-CoA dehydrogenase family protein [uncultured Agrococcus sp.]|uniref:acyl-CoA dehydrogenase family protein n=1 Tax=uncultured Agrococcus sp. TaxID=382258 RepID=UPI0025E9BAD4|nr:acyl-CoA dehydrogenase family protein [uncultured Agrococcus sp.]